jgi:hypothetical protein
MDQPRLTAYLQRQFLFSIVPVLLLFASGCSHQISGALEPGVQINSGKPFYVVNHQANSGVATAIQSELRSRGFIVTAGPEASMPSDTTYEVYYDNRWAWDMTMYLLEVKINIVNARTGKMLAYGRCYRETLVRKPQEEMVSRCNRNVTISVAIELSSFFVFPPVSLA